MWRVIRFAVAGASCVSCVAGVPAFAQSDSGTRTLFALDRTAAGAAREYVAAEHVHDVLRIPRNLLVPRSYESVLESMLQRSPTFRRQCQRVAIATHLTVTLELSPAAAASARARTRIVRDRGRITATVTILQTTDIEELIAHEIEHIIEQLDGIDLSSKAQLPHTGVDALDHNGSTFETARARRVGLKVAAEVRRPVQARASFVW